MVDVPSQARVVIVGGGIVGCSIAYHLVKRGVSDVVLLERRQLTCGTTWHAAGLVGQLRATQNLTRLAQYTTNLFSTLEAETGQATGFRARGSVSVATNTERFEELRRSASTARCWSVRRRRAWCWSAAARVPARACARAWSCSCASAKACSTRTRRA